MAEKCIRSGICHAIHRYIKASNECTKYYDQHKEPSYLKYWDLKLVAKLHDEKEYVIHIKNLKQASNHGLVFKKVHKVIKFNQ